MPQKLSALDLAKSIFSRFPGRQSIHTTAKQGRYLQALCSKDRSGGVQVLSGTRYSIDAICVVTMLPSGVAHLHRYEGASN